MFYVYVHKTLSGIPFYVGKGKGKRAFDLNHRSKEHKKIVEKYGCIIEIIFNELTEEVAFQKETELINQYHTCIFDINRVQICCNKTFGGEGCCGHKKSDNSKEKIKKSLINHCVSQETRAKISQSLKGKKQSNNTIQKRRIKLLGKKKPFDFGKKVSLAQKGKSKPYSDETKLKLCRGVSKFSLDGTFIEKFESISSAMAITKIGNISNCCHGQRKSAGGFIWKFTILNDDTYR